jgi:hypothetical protein
MLILPPERELQVLGQMTTVVGRTSSSKYHSLLGANTAMWGMT